MATRINAATDRNFYNGACIAEGQFTITGWWNMQTAPGAGEFTTLFHMGSDTAGTDAVIDLFTDGSEVLGLAVRNYNGTVSYSSILTMVVGEWYFIAVTGSCATSQPVNVYAYRLSNNTWTTATGANSGTLGTWPSPLSNGRFEICNEPATTDEFNGRAQCIKIWEGVVLTQAQCDWEAWFAMPVFEQANIWAIYPCLESGDTRDLSGAGRTLTHTSLVTEDGSPLIWAPGGRNVIQFPSAGGAPPAVHAGRLINAARLKSKLMGLAA